MKMLISALAVSLPACSTSLATKTDTTSPTDSVSLASLPSSQNIGSADSAARLDEKQKRFSQEIKLSGLVKSIQVREIAKIPFTVKNTSNFAWKNNTPTSVTFSSRWFNSEDKIVVLYGERTLLPESLAPQSSVKLNAVIRAPERPGKYNLNLTMVQENVAWFDDKGAQSLKIPITVTSK